MTIIDYINRQIIDQFLSDETPAKYRLFQRLIIYKKILKFSKNTKTPKYISPYPKDHFAYDEQEELIKYGLLTKRKNRLQITIPLYQKILDEEWIKQQIDHNPTYREILLWSDALSSLSGQNKEKIEQQIIDLTLENININTLENITDSIKLPLKTLIETEIIKDLTDSENPYYPHNLSSIQQLLDDNSQDKFPSFQRLIILRNILNSKNIPAYANGHPANSAQKRLENLKLLTQESDILKLANPHYESLIQLDFIQEQINANLFYKELQKLYTSLSGRRRNREK